ncbi:unnamed protein product [Gadus morhua 'NCC']
MDLEKGGVFILLCLYIPSLRPLSLDASTSMRWYPKTLPCNVSLASNGSAVMVDCTEKSLTSIPSGIPGNATNLTLTINHIPELNASSFHGLENLTEIDMRCNCVPMKIGPKDRVCTKGLTIMEDTFSDLKKLQALYLDGNQLDGIPRGLPPNLRLLSLELHKNAFKTLAKLKILRMHSNSLTTVLPEWFANLKELKVLDLSSNFLAGEVAHFNLPNALCNLEELDLSFNYELQKYPATLNLNPSFSVLQSLKVLRLRGFVFQSLTIQGIQPLMLLPDLEDAFSLKYLDLSFNKLKYMEHSSLPDNIVNNMDMLLLHNNIFTCTCNTTWFIEWLNSITVTIPLLATDVTCDTPGAQRGRLVLTVDMLACQYYLSLVLYILLTSTLLVFVTLAISSHLFLWDVWYIYHFCMAKLRGYGRQPSSQSCPYDAFVVYEKKDPAVSEWVMNELCVQLEERGDRPLRLCLEERDWIPGCPVVDNLCQSIHQSKRTVFVLTNRDIKSGNFKTAFYMAHQRLMDEKDDVIVLIFLEKAASNNVTIPSLKTDVYCFVSYGHPQVMIYFDFDQCVNDPLALLISILTTTFIVVTTSMATVAHIFYWDTSYVLHYLKAKLKGYRSSASQDNVYDVFVTYDTKDPWVSEWVLETLRVKLEVEGEKALPLCLEERDWPLGVPVIDNLTHSIRYSRKTLFVLTKAYAKTGVFRLAMYLAHQRLLDENLDVIVVLMLEPVLQNSHFLHLRRRLCGESVLEWPRTAAAEPWFWQNLRNVVRVDNQTMYTSTYSQYFTCSQERD